MQNSIKDVNILYECINIIYDLYLSRIIPMKRPHENSELKIPCYSPQENQNQWEGYRMSFPVKLVAFRKQKEMTQEKLAKQIGVGIAQMRRYEKGASSPTLEVIKNMAKVLGVSSDELIFDEREGVASTKILDPKLLEQFESLAKLSPRDQEAVKIVLESMIIKNRLEEVMPFKTTTTWSKELNGVVSEFRRGAKEHSEAEIESLVDEAVLAVRGERKAKRVKVGT